jgi:hypothetical protein
MQEEYEPSILDNDDYNAEIEELENQDEETPQEELDREEFQIIKDNLN